VIARRSAGARGGAPAQSAAQPMVRCARCGVFLPRAEAKEIDGGYVCAAEGCVPHG
jgi:formylmethanofuran dehydrogenase subunit E